MKAVFVAGHRGMVGSALVRRLQAQGLGPILTADRQTLDLRRQDRVEAWFARHDIGSVYLAAARVGGIHANRSLPADFVYDNLMIEANVIRAAHEAGVPRLLFMGSSCIYPRDAAQPLREEALMTGPLEPTNAAYAVAKIAGLQLCDAFRRQHGRDYRAVMPTNLYGPGDNFHPTHSHVIPGLMRRLHEAAQRGDDEVTVWGSGRPRREFLHVDDLADACVHLMELPAERFASVLPEGVGHVNVGTGVDCSIAELVAHLVALTGFQGEVRWDASMPDGTPRKCLDVTRLQALGWRSRISWQAGLASVYEWFTGQTDRFRG